MEKRKPITARRFTMIVFMAVLSFAYMSIAYLTESFAVGLKEVPNEDVESIELLVNANERFVAYEGVGDQCSGFHDGDKLKINYKNGESKTIVYRIVDWVDQDYVTKWTDEQGNDVWNYIDYETGKKEFEAPDINSDGFEGLIAGKTYYEIVRYGYDGKIDDDETNHVTQSFKVTVKENPIESVWLEGVRATVPIDYLSFYKDDAGRYCYDIFEPASTIAMKTEKGIHRFVYRTITKWTDYRYDYFCANGFPYDVYDYTLWVEHIGNKPITPGQTYTFKGEVYDREFSISVKITESTEVIRKAKEWNGTLNKKIPAVKKPKFKTAKKSIKVSWTKATKKNLKKFDKVEIQVCKDKKFQRTNTKRVEVKKTKKTATVKKLKKGTYYVRVRNVKGSGVNKQVSKWSKVKKVKVKK